VHEIDINGDVVRLTRLTLEDEAQTVSVKRNAAADDESPELAPAAKLPRLSPDATTTIEHADEPTKSASEFEGLLSENEVKTMHTLAADKKGQIEIDCSVGEDVIIRFHIFAFAANGQSAPHARPQGNCTSFQWETRVIDK
jgi:hypothetical protein